MVMDENGMVVVWLLKFMSEDEEVGDVKLYVIEASLVTGESSFLNVVAWRSDG